jgi:hypothetical protein
LASTQSDTVCASCGGARTEVILGTVLACGRCRGSGVEPAAELRGALTGLVAAWDHPADGTFLTRMEAAVRAAREVLDA